MTLVKESLTSDKDYLKIHMDDMITINATGVPDSDASYPNDFSDFIYANSVTINHNLGTIPLYRIFWDPNKNGRWFQVYAEPNASTGLFPSFAVNPLAVGLATTNQLKIIMGSKFAATSNIPVYYRIYNLGSVSANSDLRIDKVFSKQSGTSSNVGGAGSSFDPASSIITIPHGQSTWPLWTLQFSEDGTNWYGEGSRIYGPPDTSTGPPGGPYSVYYYTSVFAFADDSNFYVVLNNNYPSTKTLHYRYALDYRI